MNIKRFKKSLRYAWNGISKTYKEEPNLQVQSKIAIIIIIFAVLVDISKIEWILLIFTIGIVLMAELTNSAVERIADILKPRLDKYVKEIKDIMAGVVLVASIMAIIIGILIFLV